MQKALKALWLGTLYIPPGLAFTHFILITRCIYLFCMNLRINSDYSHMCTKGKGKRKRIGKVLPRTGQEGPEGE